MSLPPKPIDNPFKLEKDNKKFFIDMIKNAVEVPSDLMMSASSKLNRSQPAETTESRIKNLNK